MGTNTGIGIGIGIPFRNNALGGDNIYFPPELKARMIGVWDNYGKKNTDADRNIIKNKIPNAGGDLEILNSAYKLNSGFGEYREDFTSWIVSKEPMTVEKTDSQVHISYIGTSYKELPMFEYSGPINENYSLTVEIQGIPNNVIGKFIHNNGFTQEVTNGINTIKFSNSGSWYGFTFYREDNTIIGDCNITIKQIPAFEGALVTDGINDIIASIKTLEDWNIGNKGITIVSMIHQINTNTNNFITTNNIRTDNKVIGRNIVSNIEKTGIYGWYKENIQSDTINVINNILGDKNDYTSHSSPSTNINPINNSKFYVQGYVIENGFAELSSVAHYWTFAVLGKATEDEINLIIAKYNLDRTLRPDILCNITKQGITNDNHADFNNKLIDYSGNGRDIQMYNLAWKGGSGIAAKQYESLKDWIHTPFIGTTVIRLDEFSYNIVSNNQGYWQFRVDKTNEPTSQIRVITDRKITWVNNIKYKVEGESSHKDKYKTTIIEANTPTIINIAGFDFFDPIEGGTFMSVLNYGQVADDEGYTLTILPSCKGGILLDGINDFGKVTGMPIYKDYTFIIEREFLNETFPNQVCLVSKSKVASEIENGGAFIVDNISVNSIINPYSFYKTTSLPGLNTFDRQIVFQSKYKYLDKDIAAGTSTDSDTLWLGTFRDNDSRFANVAIYFLMSFPYSMSEFLIERQLKKHKLGTLYPDMVEFRPIFPKDDRIESVSYYVGLVDAKVGSYYPITTNLGIGVKMVKPYKITALKMNGVRGVYNGANGFNFILGSKSPQKFTNPNIVVDTSIILFNPTINSNAIFEVGNEQNMTELIAKVRNHEIDGFIMYLSKLESKYILPNSWINKDTEVIASIYCLDNTLQDDLHINIDGNSKYCLYADSSNNIAEFIIMDDNIFEEQYITNVLTANTIDIQLDQYIRYEDIVQPYPVLLRFNDENGNEVSWGGKFRVGSTITRIGSAADSNLLPNIYNIFGLLLNDNQVTSSKVIVEKTMVFKAKSAYIFDNNEPNCILSPRLLRIPNSSYKILGYIPDISGHGNHGILHNSAYIEGSGVNEDGSYQFDGVDNFVTIPTVTGGGKQVFMKINNNDDRLGRMIYDQRSPSSGTGLYSDFAIYTTEDTTSSIIAYQSRLSGNTYIDGILNTNITCKDLQGVLQNITITCDIVKPNNGVVPYIGTGGYDKNIYGKFALYDYILFDNISTDDKIKELNEYVGIEAKVELPPYYWDAYGKTNLDADKATIQQRGVAEGDYDITNYNHAYDKMSGYGGYEFAKFDNVLDWYLTPNNNHIDVVSRNGYEITLKNLSTSVYGWYFQNSRVIGFITRDIPFKVKANKSIRVYWDMHSYKISSGEAFGHVVSITTLNPNEDTSISLRHLTEEELVELDTNKDRMYYLLWFDLSTLAVDEEVTIEMLPLYPNGLVYDGVTDYSENANIPMFDDFTFLVKASLPNGFTGSGGAIAKKGSNTQVIGGGYDFVYALDSSTTEANRNSYWSFGKALLPSTGAIDPPLIGYMTKTDVNGIPTTAGTNPSIEGITFSRWAGHISMIFYKAILYPKTIPLLQINFLKNLMERDEIIDLDNPIFKK